MSFGEELKELRVKNNISLKELCDEIGYGVAPYSLIENGKRTVEGEDIRDYLYFKVQRAIHFICESEDYKYVNITDEKLTQCQEMLNKGINVVKAAVELGVDENKLKKELNKRKISFIDFNY